MWTGRLLNTASVKEQTLNRCREHLDSIKKEKKRKEKKEEETKRSSVSGSILCSLDTSCEGSTVKNLIRIVFEMTFYFIFILDPNSTGS